MAYELKYDNDGNLETEYRNCFEVGYTFNNLYESLIENKEIKSYTLYFYSCVYEYFLHVDISASSEGKYKYNVELFYDGDNEVIKSFIDKYWYGIELFALYKRLRDCDDEYQTIIGTVLLWMDDFNKWVDDKKYMENAANGV